MRSTLFTVTLALAASASPAAELTNADKHRIDQALPESAPAEPKKPRRVLVSNFNVRQGKVRDAAVEHPSTPYGNYAIARLGEKTSAYEVVFSDDVEMFRPGVIDQFDAVCFNNTVGVLTEDPVLRQSLLDFVAGGKGFIGFHAAAATFVEYPVYDQFPPFGLMVGGTENGGHPWRENEAITLRIDDANSALTAMFPQEGFDVRDEVYQLQEPDLRSRLHVLMSIDPKRTDMGPDRRILKIRRSDLDFPISWVKKHGKGRVFYTSLGHSAHVFSEPRLLAHFLAGIQYALGDLEAADAPSGK